MKRLLIAGVALAAPVTAVEAQTMVGQTNPEEIIVTARKRAEPIQDVPFAITLLDDEELANRRIDDPSSLFRNVPGLSLTSFNDGRFAYFQLRGIGPLTQALSPDDGSVVTYVDGVPQPVYASEFSYLDIERVEVLKGPQGTLYGRNAQAGAINIITRQPGRTFEGGARIEFGEDDYLLSQALVSGPVSRDFSAGVAFRTSTIDGFVRNIAPIGGDLGDHDSYSGRATLVYAPSGDDGLRAVLAVSGDQQRTQPFFYSVRPLADPPIVAIDPINRSRRTSTGVSLTVDLPLRGALLSSISALNGYRYRFRSDDTDSLIYGPLFGLPPEAFLPPLDFSNWRERERRFYQELRLSNRPGAAFDWVVGGAYFRSRFDAFLINRSSFSPFLNGDRDNEQRIDSYAGFAEVTAPLGSPRLKGTLGARYTRDDKSQTGVFTGAGFPGTVPSFVELGERSFDLVTGRAALTYEPSDALTVYGTVARGAKSGGFPRFTLNAALGQPSAFYDRSATWSYELGAKGDFAGGLGRFDLAAFYNDTDGEQLFILDFVTFQFLPANLDTRSYGLEAQASYRLTDGLDLSGGLAWTRADIRETGPAGAERGNRVPNVPRLSTNLTLNYRGLEGLFGTGASPIATITHQYFGRRAADVANSFFLRSYHNVDARIGVAFDNLEAFAFGRNLTDDTQEINGVLYGPGVEASSVARGRTIGIGISGRF